MSDIEWIPEDDWGTVKVGDLVKLENGEESAAFRVILVGKYPSQWVKSPSNAFSSCDWTLFVQKPGPVQIVPAVGYYFDKDGDLFNFDEEDIISRNWAKYAPFTRLEPVPETAKKILDRFLDAYESSGQNAVYCMQMVAEEFTVAPNMTFEAKYPGRCFDCDAPILEGDQAIYVDGYIEHADHGEAEMQERPDNETCTQCWLIKPCECQVTL